MINRRIVSENLYQCDLPSQELTAKLLSELNSTLHELQTTTVELLDQNDEMALNRLKLEEERGRYQELFDFAPDGYLVTDTEGIILEANKAVTELFNVSRPSIIGKPLAIFVSEEERLSFRTRLTEIKKEIVVQNENWEFMIQSGERSAFPVSIILSKIFDPYFSTKEDGSGLGLTICYSIVKKHGRHISVQSVEGKGTSFTVFLPVSNNIAEDDIPEENLIFGEGRVLLMDDQESVRQTANEMLTFLGYNVELAKDGDEAVRLYKEAFLAGHSFDVVITDLTVRGGMGGKMAMSEIINFDPDVKAIVSSGYSSDDALSDYKKHGLCGVIPKPYRLQELGKVLSSVIQGRKN